MAAAVQNWADFDAAYDQTRLVEIPENAGVGRNNRGNACRIYLELAQS